MAASTIVAAQARQEMLMCSPVFMLLLGALAQSGGLAAIDRKIAKGPTFNAAEQFYALLVLGPEAEKRVWFVVDGERLFVDLNGNGDLTDPGEVYSPSSLRGKESYCLLSREWEIPKLAVSDRYSKLKVSFSLIDPAWLPEKAASNRQYMEKFMGVARKTPHANKANIQIEIGGSRTQFCNAMFTTTAGTAPIFHMDGPLTLGVVESILPHEFGRTPELEEVKLAIGTPGYGGDQLGCFSYVMYSEFPNDARPILEIEFPSEGEGRLATRRYALDRKC